MIKKMLVLALLIPGVAGCVVSEDRGRSHDDRGRHEGHHDQRAVSAHTHGAGCGHVFRGGIWIVGY